jgi:hypothetical protein
LDGISGGAERVRAHVADGYGLTGGSRGSACCARRDIARGDATDEAATNLRSSAHLSSGERPSAGDGNPRAVVSWSFGLE